MNAKWSMVRQDQKRKAREEGTSTPVTETITKKEVG